jgi:hypothetical protein
VVAPNISVYGNTMFQNWQGINSFHSNLVEGTHMGVVNVPKVRNIWPTWNLHLGGVQDAVGWEVQVTPLGALGWDEVLGVHWRG